MNTPVSLPIAKLLKEKGFDIKTEKVYGQILLNTFKLVNFNFTEMDEESGFQNAPYFLAPTIDEVKWWLYEKHKIWITVDWSFSEKKPSTKVKWHFGISNVGNREKCIELIIELIWYNSPTEAYEAGIE